MAKNRSKRHHIKKRERRINRKWYIGKVEVVIILIVAIGLAATMIIGPMFDKPTVPTVQANSCLDFDPPSVSDVVMFNNIQYNAIKKNAGVENSKIDEMQKVGKLADGTDVYKMPGGNYFGEKLTVDIIYVLRDQKQGYHYFDIYIKDGDVIPDAIRNSKSIGANGPISIIIDDNSQFPPQGFDVDQIKNLKISINHLSYVYDGTKTTAQSVTNLAGVQIIGTVATVKGDLNVYYHLGTTYIIFDTDAYEYLPSDTKLGFTGYKASKDNLQLRKFTLKKTSVNPVCWYTPECKPAIYLYPEKRTSVNVKIMPKGYLTYANPKYPGASGWQVIANPDGKIETNNELFGYLYYESNIRTSEVKVPTEGYVVGYDKLPEFYSQLLPKLGLSNIELSDFTEYWNRVLPKSPYYFVGIMDRQNIDSIEQMSIIPQPNTVVRVRLYFEALKTKKEVKEPDIKPVIRPASGFTVVEWGGMVKSDPNSPFTCSQ